MNSKAELLEFLKQAESDLRVAIVEQCDSTDTLRLLRLKQDILRMNNITMRCRDQEVKDHVYLRSLQLSKLIDSRVKGV